MDPRILDMQGETADPQVLQRVAHHLRGGGLVAMPTETVYGFGCLPRPAPLRKLQRMKGRDHSKPFLLLIPEADAVPGLEWTLEARELSEVFWPGALTLVLRDPSGAFPSGVRSPEGAVAIRVSPHPLAMAVLGAVNEPVVSTSANLPGGTAALNARDALETARAMGAGEELWVLNGGLLKPSDPSTIVDCSGPRPLVRRSGAIPLKRLRCVIPEIHEPL